MELGCFNRPWSGVDLERAFTGIAAAGFRACGLLRHQGKAILGAESTPEAVAQLQAQTARLGLPIRCNLVRVALDVPTDVSVAQLEAEVDTARSAGVPHLLTTGVTDPPRYETFFAVLKATAPYAAKQGVTLGLKPHGGISGTNRDCVAAVERVGSTGFGIWYDPGNIIHYMGTDPAADLEAVVPYVVGMCVKDCAGGKGGSVSITPGDGEVDFQQVFSLLQAGGFDGPALVECLGGTTPEEVDREARRVHDALINWTGG